MKLKKKTSNNKHHNIYYYVEIGGSMKTVTMKPEIHHSCYIHETAVIVGDVIIEKGCSVWPNAVIRGDLNRIHIKEGANIQDNCVIHVTDESITTIGVNSSIGHGAVLHGSIIGDNCIIGMNASILDDSIIGDNSIVGAGAVVKSGTHAPPCSLLVGSPAKVIKTSEKFKEIARINASNYHRMRDKYNAGDFEFHQHR